MKKTKLAASIALSLFAVALHAPAHAENVDAPIEKLEVRGTATEDNNGIMPVLVDGKLFEGKKTSVVDLTEQQSFVEPNLRQMFARLPGLFVSEQKVPSFYNVNYRGLGDPHESEFIAFFQNNVPLAANRFGYATAYYMPGAQRVERVEFIRGGAGLMYGPQVGPVVNFVTRRPDARAETEIRSEHAIGSDGLYSTYNEARWKSGDTGFMASFDHRKADGPRQNEDFEVSAGYLGFSYEGFDAIRLGMNLDIYRSESGEAGRLTSREFASNRDLVKSPFNRVIIDQSILNFTYDQTISNKETLNANVWLTQMDRFSRRSSMFIPPAAAPTIANLDEQKFKNLGMDLRYSLIWGQDNILTAGTTLDRGDSPRTRHNTRDIQSNKQNPADLIFDQDRVTTYKAVYVENLFNFGKFSLAPTMRFERVNYDMVELVKQANLRRPAIDLDKSYSEALFGLSSNYKVSETSAIYANISESFRPQRFDDLINPSSELAGSNGPKASSAMNYEIGFRSEPMDKLVLDFSLFQIDFKDKIEQRQVNVSDIERINSGDSRHKGIELSLEYGINESLTWFANGSLLDSEITRSVTASLVGNEASFSPDHILRTGLMYKEDAISVTLAATSVGEQYWQDSNRPAGTGNNLIAAEIPSYQVVDFNAEYDLSTQWTVYMGISNLLDENYYSRVRSDGIDPAPERTGFVGIRVKL